MWLATMFGMALFMVATISLAALSNAALSEPTSVWFMAGMSVFMVAPMAAWMRIRGSAWTGVWRNERRDAASDCGKPRTAVNQPTRGACVDLEQPAPPDAGLHARLRALQA
jgi:hypothetical protein